MHLEHVPLTLGPVTAGFFRCFLVWLICPGLLKFFPTLQGERILVDTHWFAATAAGKPAASVSCKSSEVGPFQGRDRSYWTVWNIDIMRVCLTLTTGAHTSTELLNACWTAPERGPWPTLGTFFMTLHFLVIYTLFQAKAVHRPIPDQSIWKPSLHWYIPVHTVACAVSKLNTCTV